MICLLDERHFLERQLHAEITSRHHDGVRRVENSAEVLERGVLLDLGDQLHPRGTRPRSCSMSSGRRTNEKAT